MPLGKEVGLGTGYIVLDGDPVGTQGPAPHSSPSPLFGPCLFWPNGRPSQQLLSSCYSESCIKICWFFKKLRTKISWFLFFCLTVYIHAVYVDFVSFNAQQLQY